MNAPERIRCESFCERKLTWCTWFINPDKTKEYHCACREQDEKKPPMPDHNCARG